MATIKARLASLDRLIEKTPRQTALKGEALVAGIERLAAQMARRYPEGQVLALAWAGAVRRGDEDAAFDELFDWFIPRVIQDRSPQLFEWLKDAARLRWGELPPIDRGMSVEQVDQRITELLVELGYMRPAA